MIGGKKIIPPGPEPEPEPIQRTIEEKQTDFIDNIESLEDKDIITLKEEGREKWTELIHPETKQKLLAKIPHRWKWGKDFIFCLFYDRKRRTKTTNEYFLRDKLVCIINKELLEIE